jgi:hypothetical protein
MQQFGSEEIDVLLGIYLFSNRAIYLFVWGFKRS